MIPKMEKSGIFKKPYLELRKNIGYLAILLPVLVVIGGMVVPPNVGLQGSISAYYHTEMRNVFVGILFATGIFLLSYNPVSYDTGYSGAQDRRFGVIGGILAILVALFPTTRPGWEAIEPAAVYPEGFYGLLHLVFTGLFFATLIYFSYSLFTKTSPGKIIKPGSKKALRNKIYKTCAYIMLICVSLIFVVEILPDQAAESIKQARPVFFLEFFAIWAFGVSWFVKGEALAYFQD